MDLQLATTKEIVGELLGRKTFAGVVLVSPEEHRHEGQIHNHFELFTAADTESTISILKNALESLKRELK